MSRILITGAAGYIGSRLARRLAERHEVLGLDIRVPSDAPCEYCELDIRNPGLAKLLRERGIEQVVHLAAVLEDSGNRARDYDIDVNGTCNVLDACVSANVRQLVVTSSGAAYGYHADNPAWLDEHSPLRGNAAFAYSDHKRHVEELLADYRRRHPGLKQLIFRPVTVLGADTDNQITRLFTAPKILAIAGSDSPFVFIWDEDVVDAIVQGVETERSGIYNLAGDGALRIDEVAAILEKPIRRVPAWVLKTVLWLGSRLGLSRHASEKVDFLRYRPVLDNRRLKEEFGYRPRKSSQAVLRYYIDNARKKGRL